MPFRNPLSVFVIWHPDYIDGQQIADFLYSFLCRDSSKPLVRSMGIPVYFRNTNSAGQNEPIKIDFSESEFTAVISLVSDEFIMDANYTTFIEDVYERCEEHRDKRRIYPVAISKNAIHLSPKFSAINFIRTNGVVASIKNEIKSPILHELCRFLMNMKKASEETESLLIAPPLKLFISHSKHDASKLNAAKFRDFINSETQLKSFFDTNDISFGSNFGHEIRKAASESALIVFQSDSYSDREWCRVEVLEAKSAGCPIVIVNDIQIGEKRTFPYLGNYPSIRFRNNYLEIIDLALEQALLNLYTRRLLDSLTALYGIGSPTILSTSPEMFNFIQLKKKITDGDEEFSLVIYPDPPLGSEEIDVLQQLNDYFVFITPLALPSLAKMK
jgi:hypothetical protein